MDQIEVFKDLIKLETQSRDEENYHGKNAGNLTYSVAENGHVVS